MAPELFQGVPGTPASDVYAVGVSYYYLLTGTFPFTSRNLIQLEQRHAQQAIPDPRGRTPRHPGSSRGHDSASAWPSGPRTATATATNCTPNSSKSSRNCGRCARSSMRQWRE